MSITSRRQTGLSLPFRSQIVEGATGDFTSQSDLDNYASASSGQNGRQHALFPDGSNPIGQYILIQKIPFQVIGTLEPKGAGFGSDQDDVVIVPLSTGNLRLFGQKYVRTITVQVKDSDLINTTQEQIQDLLDQRHKKQDTMITNMSLIREDATAMGNTMTLFLGSVAAISLLVGGIRGHEHHAGERDGAHPRPGDPGQPAQGGAIFCCNSSPRH